MAQQVNMSMQYQAWLDIIDRVEQVTSKLDDGIDVTDTSTKAELESIKQQLNSTLAVQDAGLLAELEAVKGKLEAIETRMDGTFDTQLTGSNIGQGYFNETRTGTFAPGESFVVVDYDEPVIIDALDWVPRNETQARIKIHVRGGGDQLINTLGTSTEGTFSPRDIVNGVSLFFDVVRFDLEATPDPLMRFHLKGPLYCPDGVVITLYNRDDEKSFRNSLQVRGRIV